MDGSFHSPATGAEHPEPMAEHLPVMLSEALTGLGVADGSLPAGSVLVDGTFGRGGHSGAVLQALAGQGVLHAFDQDPAAEASAARFAGRSDFVFHRANFAQLKAVAQKAGIAGRITGLLLDLGVSSPQFDDAERGFSFSHDGPLDMRMNPDAGLSAAEWLAQVGEDALANVLFEYGDERNSRRIARRIVETRVETPITRTAQLAALIASVPGPRSKTIHPATRSFQAIRIHINGELDALKAVLADSVELLAPNGRLAVISFHSLEDRIVKQFLREVGGARREAKNKYAEHSQVQSASAIRNPQSALLTELGRYFPSEAECAVNPRARSAVLRVAQKSGAGA